MKKQEEEDEMKSQMRQRVCPLRAKNLREGIVIMWVLVIMKENDSLDYHWWTISHVLI